MERARIRKTLKPSEDFQRASDNMIEGVSAREITVVKQAAKAPVAVKTGIAENGDPNSDMFVVDLDEMVDGSSSSKATRSRALAEARDENAFNEAPAHCVPIK